MRNRITFLLCLCSCFCVGQSNLDSVNLLLKNASHDTVRLNILNDFIENTNEDKVWAPYNAQMKKLSENLLLSGDLKTKTRGARGLAAAMNNLGYIENNQGNTMKALEYYHKALKIQEKINDKSGLAYSLNNIGYIYNNQGQIKECLEFYGRALKIQEEIGDKRGIAASLNNIAFIYVTHGQRKESVLYFERSLKLREEAGDQAGIANSLNNLAFIYNNAALELSKKGGTADSIAMLSKKGLDYFQRSLALRKKIGDKAGMANSLNNMGGIYLMQKKYALARAYSDSSLALAKALNYPDKIRFAEELQSKIDSASGNGMGAYEHYKQFIIYRDIESNEETRKESMKQQMTYEYEKKETIAKAQQDKKNAVAEADKRKQSIVIWCVAGGLLLVIVFAAFVFRSLRITKKQKLIIEEKQRAILDSINYAKRIQESLLPSEKYIQKNLTRLKKK